jgi:hypothetical protein
MRINSVPEPILLADNTSVITTGRNLEDSCSESNLVLSQVIMRFAAINLVPNLDKTNILKFLTKNSSHSTLHMGYKKKVYSRDSECKISWLSN